MSVSIIVFGIVLIGVAGFLAYQASQREAGEFRTIQSLPPSAQHVVSRMAPDFQTAFFNEYEAKKRNLSVAYVLWFCCGLHYVYVRQIGLQVAYWITGGGFGIWSFIDLFRMPSIVRDANEQTARIAIQTLGIAHQMGTTAMAAPPMPAPMPPPIAPPVVHEPPIAQLSPAPVDDTNSSSGGGADWWQSGDAGAPGGSGASPSARFCSQCGTSVAASGAFCSGCGSPMA